MAGFVVFSLALTACRENEYLGRRDTISLGAGDAAASNRVVHIIDPWPRHAKDKSFGADGKRMMVGIKRYQENESLEPVGTDTTERFRKDEPPKDPEPGGPPGSQ